MIYNMFNEDLLTQYWEPYYKGQHMELVPPPNIINEEEEYEVEEIRKYWKKGTQFLVHWKRYRNEHNQWIAESGLLYAKGMIKDYWARISSRNL